MLDMGIVISEIKLLVENSLRSYSFVIWAFKKGFSFCRAPPIKTEMKARHRVGETGVIVVTRVFTCHNVNNTKKELAFVFVKCVPLYIINTKKIIIFSGKWLIIEVV